MQSKPTNTLAPTFFVYLEIINRKRLVTSQGANGIMGESARKANQDGGRWMK